MGMSKKITMKEFIMNDRWNLDKLKNILNDQAFQLITDIDIGDQNKEDYAIWNASADGQYSNKNAWHLIRSTKQKHEALNNMWHNCIPFKLFFLAWRLYFGKLPFDQVLAKLETWRPIATWKQVIWEKPPTGRVKINTDGSFRKESGKAGLGGIVRDDKGDLIIAFSLTIRGSSNNCTEVMAAKLGLQWCLQQGYNNLYLEVDSQIVANILIAKKTNNLKLQRLLKI
uniref:Uncharacterized protein LOC104217121 n=1 Tax=Nicotiana sylvestris TaxID=4096 RepID=A0A1U7VC18_NICSY|nr:PREDICTED: uncharacterized protein LOC104217121 [Nicotiana sylvestris]